MLLYASVVLHILGPEYERTVEALRWLAPFPFLKKMHYLFLSEALTGLAIRVFGVEFRPTWHFSICLLILVDANTPGVVQHGRASPLTHYSLVRLELLYSYWQAARALRPRRSNPYHIGAWT